jgi:hypothetical protein
MPSKPRLFDQVRERMRLRHYSLRTEESYLHWIKRFVLFQGRNIPARWEDRRSRRFSPIWRFKMAAATQNQALSALLFLQLEHHLL